MKLVPSTGNKWPFLHYVRFPFMSISQHLQFLPGWSFEMMANYPSIWGSWLNIWRFTFHNKIAQCDFSLIGTIFIGCFIRSVWCLWLSGEVMGTAAAGLVQVRAHCNDAAPCCTTHRHRWSSLQVAQVKHKAGLRRYMYHYCYCYNSIYQFS